MVVFFAAEPKLLYRINHRNFMSFQKNYIYDTFIVSVAKLRWLIRQSNLGSAAKKKTATYYDTPFT